MPSPLEELESAALALPRQQRARLARELIDSLENDDELDTAWRDEVRRRLDAYRSGNMEATDASEVLEEARDLTNQ